MSSPDRMFLPPEIAPAFRQFLNMAAVAGILGACPVAGVEPPTMAPDESGFAEIAQPFLREHCLSCHGPKKEKGHFRVDQHLPNTFLDPAAKEKWAAVVDSLNGHEMPPEDEPQPAIEDVGRIVDWITEQMVRAEMVRRDGRVVLRRLNRDEYRNTMRDLVGVDYDVSAFPLDPAAGGFDNNGQALTVSPMHLELFIEMGRKILDRALVEGDPPATIKWHFEPEDGSGDDHRQRLDPKNNPIVQSGKNVKRDGWAVMHHESWDRNIDIRDFRVPVEGEYMVRIRAAGKVPGRDAVVKAAREELEKRVAGMERDGKDKEAKWNREHLEEQLDHFRQDRMYEYGPPRLKLTVTLGGQPRVLSEFDVDASPENPREFEFRARFTTETAGLGMAYDYSIPRVLENFWMQGHDDFPRPEALVDWVELEGPIAASSWPPPSHRAILFDSPLATTDERAYARQVLDRFMRRAYRRPVAPEEIEEKLALYDAARKEGAAFLPSIKVPLIAVLASPHFLYLVEPAGTGVNGLDQPATRVLSDHELAARLSYFLWSSMPDAELSSLADEGKLRDPAVLDAQVDRLLADPHSEALVSNFAGQWLRLREVGANPPAPDLFPRYDRHLETSLIEESKAFFAEILRQDLSALNFIKSDFLVINERLGRFYGVEGVRGDYFRKVPAPAAAHRGGIVTQAAMLTITSNGTRTSPVKRGTWVLENVLGISPGLPVANVGDIKPKVPGIDKATVRQRLTAHRELPQCARCHSKIDPLGLALENFNAAGEWRAQEGFGYKGRIDKDDPVIDASAKLPDGTEFVGVEGLQAALLQKEDLFLHCLAGKLFTYALGRELGVADQPMVKAATGEMKQNGYTLRSLIHGIVASTAFRTK